MTIKGHTAYIPFSVCLSKPNLIWSLRTHIGWRSGISVCVSISNRNEKVEHWT
jgi:hypothetical protein